MTLLLRPALLFGSVDGVGGCRRPVVSVGVGLPCSSSIVLGLSLRVKRLVFALAFIGVAMSSGLPCSSATSLPSVSADRGGLRYATDGLLLSRGTTAAVPGAGRTLRRGKRLLQRQRDHIADIMPVKEKNSGVRCLPVSVYLYNGIR